MNLNLKQKKLVNIMRYLCLETTNCGKTKLFKLLFLLDSEHFKETGKTITDQEYFAWKYGPVPVKLDEDLDALEEGLTMPNILHEHFEIKSKSQGNVSHIEIKPLVGKFDESLFSKREMRILKGLSAQFKNTTASDLVNLTHVKGGPWDLAWKNGYNTKIDLLNSLDNNSVTRDVAEERISNSQILDLAFGNTKHGS